VSASEQDTAPTGELDNVSKDLYDEITSREVKSFNDELYRHLAMRDEYQDKELEKALAQRVDVDNPLTARFEENKVGARKTSPDPLLTPTEVIDLVLLALREKREVGDSSGTAILQRFMGPGSSIHTGTGVSSTMLEEYFAETQYAILLDWVSVQYTRKLEVSLDKRRARQQLRLKNAAGVWVPVAFQLAKHDMPVGSVWLIEQMMVKLKDEEEG